MPDYQNPYRNIDELEEMRWEDPTFFSEGIMQLLSSTNLTETLGYNLDVLGEGPRVSLKKFLMAMEDGAFIVSTHQFRVDSALTVSNYWNAGPRTVMVRPTFAIFTGPDGSTSRRDFSGVQCLKSWGPVWLGYSQLTENTREILLYAIQARGSFPL